MEDRMVEGSCHCRKITLQIDAAPAEVTDCNCSICRRYGTLWAYYAPKQVRITETVPTQTYMWDDRSIAFHRCPDCGCVTHWSPVDPARNRMGINARLLAPDVLAGARVHHIDGASYGGFTR
jgi:hypothetical protein